MRQGLRRAPGFVLTGFLATLAALAAIGSLAGGAPPQGPLPAGARFVEEAVPLLDRARSAFGYFAILAVAFALSRHRRRIDWRVVMFGVLTQLAFAVLLFQFGGGIFDTINDGFLWLANFTNEGASFIFGSFPSEARGKKEIEGPLQNFAFLVLPTIIFFCCLMTVLYHLGIMQQIVKGVAWVMQKTMRTSGAETLSAASNIFLGQTEAPLLVKPFIARMTESELMAVMTGGFATIAGSVMALYVIFLKDQLPGIGGHLMAASVLNAPAGLFLAKMFVPETGNPETRGTLKVSVERLDPNVVGAAARGAGEGVQLALNVAAMLLAFIAMVALLNGLLGIVLGWLGIGGITIQGLLGWATYPFAWLMGVRTEDCGFVSTLLGEKLVLTELWSYKHLAQSLADPNVHVHQRSAVIVTYALLGFANFASIGIQIGGIGGLAPERRGDLARLGLRAMLAGTLAAYLSACLAGIFR